MKILVAVDGSAFSRRMFAYLAAHDEWLGPAHEYTVLHVVAPLPRPAAAALGRTTVKAYHVGVAERVFKPLRSFCVRQGLRATFVPKVGDPAAVIAATADKGGHSLVMMGSHGHGALASLVLGSVATKVLAHCRVPVLIVR